MVPPPASSANSTEVLLAKAVLALEEPYRRTLLVVCEFLGTRGTEGRTFSVARRETGTLGVSDAAVALVLLNAGEEVARLPFDPLPGEVIEPRP